MQSVGLISILLALVILLSLDSTEATLDFLFSGLNLRRFLPVNPMDTSDGRFATFDGPVRGLPAGHGGGRFGKRRRVGIWNQSQRSGTLGLKTPKAFSTSLILMKCSYIHTLR
jgi:hypothetical protein